MTKALPGYLLFALLLLFTTTFALRGNLLGQTLSSAVVAPKAEVEIDSAAVAAADSSREVQALMQQILENPQRIPALPPTKIDTETLWLARCIYSETKRPEEMELVAWVVRNRVETQYRGKDSYREVVLDPYQFSAFNPQTRTRRYYSNLHPDHGNATWQKALTIAYGVRGAPPAHRPFPKTTRHFYSERSMVGRRHPDWAHGMNPVEPEREFALDARRFRFFAGVY